VLYLYHKEASKPQLTLTGDEHRYIFKVRRHKVDDTLYLRNLEDGLLHRYIITIIDKHSVILELQESKVVEIKAKKSLHIGWCVIDPKSIEMLNSSQQSGRSEMMKLEMAEDLKSFLIQNPQSMMLSFSENKIGSQSNIDTIVIGCEGGFHEDEVALFKVESIVGFDTSLVLKSESAVCAVASKVLL